MAFRPVYQSVFLYMAVLLCGWAAVPAQNGLPPRPLPAGTTLKAIISREDVIVGDPFTYGVLLDGNQAPEQYRFPAFSATGALELISGPSRRTEHSIINGRSSMRTMQLFQLRALEEGEITIPPAEVRINGMWYKTSPVTIDVKGVPEVDSDLEAIISARTNDPNYNRLLAGNMFARVEVPEVAYRGQAVPVNVYIYRDPRIQSFLRADVVENLRGDDFIIPDVVDQQLANRRPNWESVRFADRNFQRMRLFTAYAIPTKTGRLLLNAPRLRAILPPLAGSNQRPRFDDLFGNMSAFGPRQVVADLPIRAFPLRVEEPPKAPADVVDLIVGDHIRIEAEVDRTSLLRRELVTYKIRFTGEGFFELLSRPRLDVPSNLSEVDTTTRGRFAVDQEDLVSQKEFEYTFQALEAGEIEIPSFRFAVFNPTSQEMEVVATEAIAVAIKDDGAETFQIGGATGGGTGEGGAPERARARELGRDVAYINTQPLTVGTIGGGAEFYTRPWFWALQAAPVLLGLAFGIVMLLQRTERNESSSSRVKRAQREGEKSLRAAAAKIDGAGREAFYAMLSAALEQFAAALDGRSSHGLTTEEADALLARGGCDGETRESYRRFAERCAAIRYSPVPDTREERQKALDEARGLMERLAREARPL